MKVLLEYNRISQAGSPESKLRQLLTPQANVKAGSKIITTTILANLFVDWIHPSVKKPGGTYATKDKSPAVKERADRLQEVMKGLEGALHASPEFVGDGNYLKWCNYMNLRSNPEKLWVVLFPGINNLFPSASKKIFMGCAVSDGYSINCQFFNKDKPTTKSQDNSNTDLKFGFGDWRSATLETPTASVQTAASIHKIAGARDKTKGDGLSSIKGHKGKPVYIDSAFKENLLKSSKEELKEVYDNHVIVSSDLGLFYFYLTF